MASYSFTYPSTREANELVLDDLRRCLEAGHVEGHLFNSISICVSEAFTNAAVHGNCENPLKTVVVRFEVNENQVIADIVDQGSGGMSRIGNRKPATVQDEGGRGIDLIRHFADDCHFAETESGGLRVTIHFQRMGKKEYTT
jgi:anti-sigma regulatory factor (Ser/Thr protein kinase)